MQTAEELIRQLRAPDQRGMGRAETVENGPTNVNRLADLDEQASTIRVWDPTIIPGNLQIDSYSDAVIRAAQPNLPLYEVRRRVLLKAIRSRTFLRRTFDENLARAWFVLGEKAIIRCLVTDDGGEVHAQQLWHLSRLMAHEKIVVQVLPESVVVPSLAGAFTLYGLDGDQRVGYVETVMGAWYSTRLNDLARLHSTFSDIASLAMSPSSTRRMIGEVLSTWRSASGRSPDSTTERSFSSPLTPPAETSALESPEAARARRRTEP